MSDALLSRTDLLETQCEPIDMVCNNVVAMPLIQTETIATYQRVSSDEQSTVMQAAWLRQTLTNQGLNYDLAQHFIDEDTSATKKKDIDQRPEGKKLLDMIQKGAISRLFVYRLDRLFRDTEYAAKFLKVLAKKKVQLFSNDFAGDLTSADGQFTYGLQMLLAARETAVLGERVQDTMDKNTEALIPNSKIPPYGWDFVGVGNPKFNHGKGMVDVKVLVIHEVDFDMYGIEFMEGVLSRQAGSIDPAVQYANAAINVSLTGENDPESTILSNPSFIAGRQLTTLQGVSTNYDNTPDTASYGSTGSKHPLAIVADGQMYLFLSAHWNGNDPANATKCGISAGVRIMAQRAVADASTYAALLTRAFNG